MSRRPILASFTFGLLLASSATVSAQARSAPSAPTAPASPSAADTSGDPDPHGMAAMRMENLSDEAARSHFRVGQTLYSEGRFGEAGAEFENAYNLSHRPVLLYNAYLAYRDAGDLANSIRTLAQYLAEQPNPEDAAVLERRLAAMQASRARELEMDRAAEAERERIEAERQQLAAEADARRAEEARTEAARRARSKGPWILMASGGALFLASGATALVTHARQNDANAKCPDGSCALSVDLTAMQDGIRRPAIATDVLLGAGFVTVLSSFVWLARDRRRVRDLPPVTASCGRTGCDLQYRLSF